MTRKLVLSGLALVVVTAGAIGARASLAGASPIQLLLSQSQAFTLIGHSCGGIQEKAYATQFDPSSGYPDGDVYVSTSCGGSGRGGGYRSTTYSAWAAVTWDFTGAVVTYGPLSGSASYDPSLSVFDGNGNQLYNSSNSAYLVLASGFVPAPRVIGISSAVGPAAGGTSVTITGTGFTATTGVSFGGVPAASFSVAGDTSITALSPSSSAGTIDVTVTSPGGTSATGSFDQFTFVAAPTVSGIDPASGPLTGGTQVDITGTGFTGATTVRFGGDAVAFTVVDDSHVTASSPVVDTPDTADVTVTTVGGTSATSPADVFTFTATAPTGGTSGPVVTAVSPATGPGGGGTKVVVGGQNLSGATAVTFGGIEATRFQVNAAGTALVAWAPPGTGTVDVQVAGPAGTSSATGADLFTYVPPVVSSLGTASGPAGGGTRVRISGADFRGVTGVSFGGIPAASFVVNRSGTVVTAWTPPEAGSGVLSVDVSVTTPAGTGTLPAAFTYAAPVVSRIAPATGPAAGGTSVILRGNDLYGASAVYFGGTAATIESMNNKAIVVLSPPGSGTVDVTVVTSAGTSSTTSADLFTY